MNTRFSQARDNESGFTLVELLVVIAIIAILTAIAVPAFLNQRQKANDAAVRSDMKTVVTQIETGLVDNPVGNVVVTGTPASGSTAGAATVSINGVSIGSVALTKGVDVDSHATLGGNANRYVIQGSHSNGGSFKTATPLYYDSANGGFTQTNPAPVVP